MTAPRIAALLLTTIALAGCVQSDHKRFYMFHALNGEDRPATYLGLPLESGQVILSEAPGPYSFLFALGPEEFTNFTHAAIVVMEGGEPFVYDMSGEYKAGFEARPTDAIEGTCRRVPFEEYCKGNLYAEIFDPGEGVDREKVAAWAQAKHKEQVAFDPYFDLKDQEKLFCTEFVKLALEAGGAQPIQLVRARRHPALNRLFDWLAVSQEWGLPAGVFEDPKRRICAIGQFPTRASAYCYFAAKREIHRRFSDDQLLGNLFVLDAWSDIALRPTVAGFLQRAINIYSPQLEGTPSRAEIDAKVQALAGEMFGLAEEATSGPSKGG